MLATSLLLLQTPCPPSGTTSGGTVEHPDTPTQNTSYTSWAVQGRARGLQNIFTLHLHCTSVQKQGSQKIVLLSNICQKKIYPLNTFIETNISHVAKLCKNKVCRPTA